MKEYEEMDTVLVQNALVDVLAYGTPMEDTALEGCTVKTFFEGGVLSIDEGLVIRTADGSEFQLTIIQSR